MTANKNTPKFSANLSLMFQEVPFMARFAAAAKTGFKAVEFMFPYDYPVADLKKELVQDQKAKSQPPLRMIGVVASSC